jgi:predicted acetyltransferase
MRTELVVADSSDADLINSLLDEYLLELGSYRDMHSGAIISTSYPYLDAYWSEPGRHVFIIQCDSNVVGFALIRDPTSTKSAVYQLAEFYIKPESRHLGIGRSAIRAILKRFPGQWELQVHTRNSAAVQFWESCLKAVAGELLQRREVQGRDGRRIQFHFSVEDTV